MMMNKLKPDFGELIANSNKRHLFKGMDKNEAEKYLGQSLSTINDVTLNTSKSSIRQTPDY